MWGESLQPGDPDQELKESNAENLLQAFELYFDQNKTAQNVDSLTEEEAIERILAKTREASSQEKPQTYDYLAEELAIKSVLEKMEGLTALIQFPTNDYKAFLKRQKN